jgi:hypothetical protein
VFGLVVQKYLSFAFPEIGQGVATDRQTRFNEVKLWLAAVATLTAVSSLSAGGGEDTPVYSRAQLPLYLKHADSGELERIEDIVLFFRSLM